MGATAWCMTPCPRQPDQVVSALGVVVLPLGAGPPTLAGQGLEVPALLAGTREGAMTQGVGTTETGIGIGIGTGIGTGIGIGIGIGIEAGMETAPDNRAGASAVWMAAFAGV